MRSKVLSEIEIKGFKCFDEVIIPLRKINLFTGTNSSGKSSAIQALLLMIHNAAGSNSSPLNGMWLRLGSFDECRNHILNKREFSISLKKNEEAYTLTFSANGEEGDLAEVKSLESPKSIIELLKPENSHVFYIPANRQGVADYYNKNFDIHNTFGSQGEFAVDYLYRNKNKVIADELILNNNSFTLSSQVNYWLEKLLGVSININENKLSNSYSVEYKRGDTKPLRPYHVGSGVSYALSVIISCLSARKNDIVILENPEIHLHPRAQAELTEFICRVANSGVQVIIETHSDHTFNGICKAIVRNEISHNDCSIQYFHLDEDSISHNANIELNKYGRVLNHQKGLFDQFDEDLNAILGL